MTFWIIRIGGVLLALNAIMSADSLYFPPLIPAIYRPFETETCYNIPRGGASIELSQPKINETAQNLSFVSALRSLHRKSMRVKEVDFDDSSKGKKMNLDVAPCHSGDDRLNMTTVSMKRNFEADVKKQNEKFNEGGRAIRGRASTCRAQNGSRNASTDCLDSVLKIKHDNAANLGIKEHKDDGMRSAALPAETTSARAITFGIFHATVASQNVSNAPSASMFVSSGHWGTIDKFLSFGMSSTYTSLKISRYLRPIRKAAAKATGLHGLVSRKGAIAISAAPFNRSEITDFSSDTESSPLDSSVNNTNSVEKKIFLSGTPKRGERVFSLGRLFGFGRRKIPIRDSDESVKEIIVETQHSKNESNMEGSFTTSTGNTSDALHRAKRVQEIDKEICRVQKEVVELQCEKDDLQRRPNPLYNYTNLENPHCGREGDGKVGTSRGLPSIINRTSRVFNFPPANFANDYIDDLVDSGRLVLLNHSFLWQLSPELEEIGGDDPDDELNDSLIIGKEKGFPSDSAVEKGHRKKGGRNGSWLLRQSIGRGLSLGEKIGETVELAAYKSVCSSVMSILARGLSALHGVNVMTHSDIRLYIETTPELPPPGKGSLPPDSDRYAEETIRKAIRRSTKKRKRRSKHVGQGGRSSDSEDTFLQKDAVIETLISHCQISAPLLKLFPLSWQRALLGNIISLVAAIVSDFAEGIQIQILGHKMSLSFKPITERDMMNHISSSARRRRARIDEFEAAVKATAEDVSRSLEFLDRWHERALGSGMLRAQIGNLIARIVLTLTDEVLSGAKFDLWSAQIGGPRIVAGLEYRVEIEKSTEFNGIGLY